MPEAKKIRIFRVSLAGDDQTTTDRIDFNDPNDADFKDPKKRVRILSNTKWKPLTRSATMQGLDGISEANNPWDRRQGCTR